MKPELFYNGKIYTLAGDDFIADSMVAQNKSIVAVGKHLEKDDTFNTARRTDLQGKTVLPGFTDSHTHFRFFALMLANVRLDGLSSIEEALSIVKKHSAGLKKNEWVFGDGFSPDRWKKRIVPDRYMLDEVTGGRPAAIYSKDQHVMWVNSKALSLAGITKKSEDPAGGVIDRDLNGEPTGILREMPGYFPVLKIIKDPDWQKMQRLYKQALGMAYAKGITGVHSFDGPEAYDFYKRMSKKGAIGLRINYYPPPSLIPELKKIGVYSGYDSNYLRISGIKIFADGSLGSQTALCFNKYRGSRNSYGVETNTKKELLAIIKKAASLNLPCAIHAIGDKAIANVIDCYEKAPKLKGQVFHRIEHLQMIRRSDIVRLKRLNVVASMQPSHCPSDVKLIENYWGSRGRNCYIFKTVLSNKIPLIFGSDAPIEPLDPIAGIDAAVNRTPPRSRTPFYPEQRITVAEAVAGFTSGPATAAGRAFEIGRLLPGYKADFVILSHNIFRVKPSRIKAVRVLATYFDGRLVYRDETSSV